jgi:hypothetical protein
MEMSKAKLTDNINNLSVHEENMKREAKERIENDYNLFVGHFWGPESKPMLIDGLIRERGVSVFYGALDEFKTTVVLDMMVHVAMGAPWQGHEVIPRPIIWYALEGSDELPKRVRALQAKIGTGAAWGKGHAPIIVRERLPENGDEWRREISKINLKLTKHILARDCLGMLKKKKRTVRRKDGSLGSYYESAYPTFIPVEGDDAPIIVVDTLSLALGGEDEKGPKAAGFIKDCLELLKDRPDIVSPDFPDDDFYGTQLQQWVDENGYLEFGVAAHIIIIHHQTKTGIDIAGHRAIAANTQGLYRIHRFGKITDVDRPYSGLITPQRVKGIPCPAPVRFDVEVVPVEGTKQTAAILKDKAKAIPKKLKPAIESLRELEDHETINAKELNTCLDAAMDDGATYGAKRTARKRSRDCLIAAGVLEPLLDDDGSVDGYRLCFMAGA